MKLINLNEVTEQDLASITDHTFLDRPESFREKAKASQQSAVRLFEDAFEDFMQRIDGLKNKPYAVCIRPENVRHAVPYLRDTGIKIASVVGFPNGSTYRIMFKLAETDLALADGATEIDTVLNYRALKSGDTDYAMNDMAFVIERAHKGNALVKVILETSELTPEHIVTACKLAGDCGADFVKTSTGYSAYGARKEDIRLMRQNFKKGIKISGGVTKENALDLLYPAAFHSDRFVDIDPLYVRIGASKLLE